MKVYKSGKKRKRNKNKTHKTQVNEEEEEADIKKRHKHNNDNTQCAHYARLLGKLSGFCSQNMFTYECIYKYIRDDNKLNTCDRTFVHPTDR